MTIDETNTRNMIYKQWDNIKFQFIMKNHFLGNLAFEKFGNLENPNTAKLLDFQGFIAVLPKLFPHITNFKKIET